MARARTVARGRTRSRTLIRPRTRISRRTGTRKTRNRRREDDASEQQAAAAAAQAASGSGRLQTPAAAPPTAAKAAAAAPRRRTSVRCRCRAGRPSSLTRRARAVVLGVAAGNGQAGPGCARARQLRMHRLRAGARAARTASRGERGDSMEQGQSAVSRERERRAGARR